MHRWRKAVYRVPESAKNWRKHAKASANDSSPWRAIRLLAFWRPQPGELPEGYDRADLLYEDVM